MTDLESKLQALPKSPGVYLFKDAEGKVIYIGKARVLRNRVRQYFQQGHDGRYQYAHLVSRITDVEVITTDTELEALILENTLVRDQKPRYNIDLRDDKSFPYLRVTAEPFPRVFLTRHPVLDGSKYFGPFSDLQHLKGLIRVLRSMLKIRTCNLPLTEEGIAQGKFKACLELHIGRCNAPCIANESRSEYLLRIYDFIEVASGKGADVVDRLAAEMLRLAEELRFEQAAQLRDWLSALENLTQKQKVITPEPISRDIIGLLLEDNDGVLVVMQVRAGRMIGRLHYHLKKLREETPEQVLESALEHYYSGPVSMPEEILLPLPLVETDLISDWLRFRAGYRIDMAIPQRGEKARLAELAQRNAEQLLAEWKLARQSRERVPAALVALQTLLHLPRPPEVIVAFDISTLQGTDKVASMVVFHNGRAARSEYKRFKIRDVEGQDDFASMKEVVGRRFARIKDEQLEPPDLVLVDGGKGQLAAAGEALAELRLDSQPLIGLAKRLEEIFVPGDSEPLYIAKTSSALKLLQQVRDEAHRFAITYHRQLRTRRSLHSTLDDIEGVGPARRKALIHHFGTLKALREATLEQIETVPGVPRAIAESVHAFLHTDESPNPTPPHGPLLPESNA
jgi:excinuclease ABC subunit C